MPSTYDLFLQRKQQLAGGQAGGTGAQIPLQPNSSTSKVYQTLLERKQFIKEHPYVPPVIAEAPQITQPTQQPQPSLAQKAGGFLSNVGNTIGQGVTNAVNGAKDLISNVHVPKTSLDPKSVIDAFSSLTSPITATENIVKNKKVQNFASDIVKGFFGEHALPNPEISTGQFATDKEGKRIEETYKPENLGQKLGQLTYALMSDTASMQSSGINTALEQFGGVAKETLKASPKVAFVKEVVQRFASKEMALFLNKIKPLDLTFEDLQAVTGSGGIKPTDQQLVKFKLAKDLSETTGMSFNDIIKAGEKEPPKTKLYDFVYDSIQKIKQTLKNTLSPSEQKLLGTGEKELQTKTEDELLQEQVTKQLNPVKVPQSKLSTEPQVPQGSGAIEPVVQGTPNADALAKTVIGTDLENTPEGRDIMKQVAQAKMTGTDITPQTAKEPAVTEQPAVPSKEVSLDKKSLLEEAKKYNSPEEFHRAINPIPELGFKSSINQSDWAQKNKELIDIYNEAKHGIKTYTPEELKSGLSELPEKVMYNDKEYYTGGIGEVRDLDTKKLKDVSLSLTSNKIGQPDIRLEGKELQEFYGNTLASKVEKPVVKQTKIASPEIKKTPSLSQPTNKEIKRIPGVSRLQQRVQEQILQENGQRYDFDPKTAKYNVKTLKGDAENALKLVEKDQEKAIRIAKGLEAPPSDTTANNVSMAVALKARDEGNIRLFTELINKNSLRLTRFGQEIVMARGHFNDNSPVNFMKQVIDARMNNLGKSMITDAERKLGRTSSAKTKAVERIDRETKKLGERLVRDQAKIKMAQDIIDSLKCL